MPEDLIELETQQHLEEEGKMEEVQRKFSVEELAGMFSKVNVAAVLELGVKDPNVEQFMKVEQ